MASNKLLILLGSFLVVCHLASGKHDLEANFDNSLVLINIGESKNFTFMLRSLDISNVKKFETAIRVISSNPKIVRVFTEIISLHEIDRGELGGIFQADAIGLGNVFVGVELMQGNLTKLSIDHMEIRVFRNRVMQIFKAEHILLYLRFMHYFYVLMNICFGAVFDLKKVREILRNPISPIFAYIFDLIILPLTSSILGLIYLSNVESRLYLSGMGLVVMSVIHSSNHWTNILGGNINLSLLISIITNVSSFVLANLYFYSIKMAYSIEYNILDYDVYMENMFQFIVPLCIGLMLRNLYPRSIDYALVLLKWLSPLAVLNLHFFYIQSDLDLYVYGLFTWMQFLPGFISALLTYSAAWFWTVSFKLKNEDCLAIVLEALTKNICLANIVRSLSQPSSEDADVFPSSVSISTVIILLLHLLWNKLGERAEKNQKQLMETELKLIKSFNDYSLEYAQLEANV